MSDTCNHDWYDSGDGLNCLHCTAQVCGLGHYLPGHGWCPYCPQTPEEKRRRFFSAAMRVIRSRWK